MVLNAPPLPPRDASKRKQRPDSPRDGIRSKVLHEGIKDAIRHQVSSVEFVTNTQEPNAKPQVVWNSLDSVLKNGPRHGTWVEGGSGSGGPTFGSVRHFGELLGVELRGISLCSNLHRIPWPPYPGLPLSLLAHLPDPTPADVLRVCVCSGTPTESTRATASEPGG